MITMVERIWTGSMSDKERVQLKHQLAQVLGIGHAYVVGVLDFEDHEDAASAVERLLAVAKREGGGCGIG